MSYLVLARKWRPRVFTEVVGQEHITETLKKAVEKGRVAHAYLFAGPRGCGKTTTARLLAKIVNCESPRGAEPCNECSSCVAVNEGRHLDVIEIDGASNRGIDEIRDLREKISYAPSQGRSKIYIIDEVHMLTPQAFNALLKTLEEPPSHVYLIFATTEAHKVPSTIVSRCQRFNFKRLEVREIVEQLTKICAAEKIAHESEALTLLARRAEGSMRDAESLLDQCIAASDGSVSLELARRVLGLVDAQLIGELLRCIAARDRRGALAIVDRAVDAGIDLEEFFLAYVEGLRNLLVLGIEGADASEFLDLSSAEMEELGAIARTLRAENCLYLFRSAVRGYRDLKASGQPRYQLEAILAEAASWESAVELSDLLKRLGEGGGSAPAHGTGTGGDGPRARGAGATPQAAPRTPQRPSGGVEPRGSAAPEAEARPIAAARVDARGVAAAAPTAREGVSGAGPSSGAFARVDAVPGAPGVSTVAGATAGTGVPPAAADEEAYRELGGRENWERFVSQIRETKLTLGIWLVSASVKNASNDRVVLSFAPQNRFAREMVCEEKNKRFIEFQLERFFGRKMFVEAGEDGVCAGEAGVPEKPAPREQVPIDKALEAVAGGSPVIRKLIEEFDGELFGETGENQEGPGK